MNCLRHTSDPASCLTAVSPLRGWLLVCLLSIAVPSQSGLFSPAAGMPRLAESQWPWEEESDEGEPSSEEHAGQPMAAACSRERGLQTRQRGAFCERSCSRLLTYLYSASAGRPSALSRQNGVGGPLRC